jgi:hypothetical protein
MAKARWIIGVGSIVWLFLAGCSSQQVLGLLSVSNDNVAHERVVAGSMESVAQTTQTTLSQLGFVAKTTRQGDTIRIGAVSATGTKFTLVLTREASATGEQTHVRVEFDGKSDDQLAFQLLGHLDVANRK